MQYLWAHGRRGKRLVVGTRQWAEESLPVRKRGGSAARARVSARGLRELNAEINVRTAEEGRRFYCTLIFTCRAFSQSASTVSPFSGEKA